MLNLFLYSILNLIFLQSGSYLLLFPVLADYFLIFTSWYIPGILFFIVFHLGCCRYLRGSVYVMLFTAILIPAIIRSLWVTADPVVLLSISYGICLCQNLFLSCYQRKKNFILMFSLLLICDLHVCLTNIGIYFSQLSEILGLYQRQIAPYIIWCFYLPSQWILSRSQVNEH